MKYLLLIAFSLVSTSCQVFSNDRKVEVNSVAVSFSTLFENEGGNVEFSKIETLLDNIKGAINKGDYYYYKSQINGSKNINETNDYLIKSNANGNSDAGLDLFINLEHSDFPKALKFLESSANKGNSRAQRLLGLIYFSGRNGKVDINQNKAISLLSKSASNGNMLSLKTLVTAPVNKRIKLSDFEEWKLIQKIFSEDARKDEKLLINSNKSICSKINFSAFFEEHEGMLDEIDFDALASLMINCSE